MQQDYFYRYFQLQYQDENSIANISAGVSSRVDSVIDLSKSELASFTGVLSVPLNFFSFTSFGWPPLLLKVISAHFFFEHGILNIMCSNNLSHKGSQPKENKTEKIRRKLTAHRKTCQFSF